MLTQSNTNTQCKSNANSQSYRYSYTYIDGNTYAETYSVAKAAPHAASPPKPMMGQ